MTPQTRASISPMLDMRLGQGTLAGALNDQYRFRIEGNGPTSTRKFVPDSALAASLVQTPHWPKVEGVMRHAMSRTDDGKPAAILKGFILPRDERAAAAGSVLSLMEGNLPEPNALLLKSRDPEVVRSGMKAANKEAKMQMRDALALNEQGWITFAPSTSRALLAAAGAYRPGKREDIREASTWAAYTRDTPTHEVQHSVTFPHTRDYKRLGWLEEATAELLSSTPAEARRATRATGISTQSYAGALATTKTHAKDWKPWTAPTFSTPEEEQKAGERTDAEYVDSMRVVRDIVHMAGGDFKTRDGLATAKDLLQSKQVRYVPGQLTDAIIERHKIDPARREELRRMVAAADAPGMIPRIKREFGID